MSLARRPQHPILLLGQWNKNTPGTLFGRDRQPGHHTVTGSMTVEWATSVHPVDVVVVLLGGECLRPSTRKRCGLVPFPYLVSRCGSVPKAGTASLLDLHFTLLNIS